MQTCSFKVMVPSPMAGMRAPLASMTFMAFSLSADVVAGRSRSQDARRARRDDVTEHGKAVRRLPTRRQWASATGLVPASCRAEHREGDLRRLVDHLEQRARRPARRALALLPVAHRLDRHADAGGKLAPGSAWCARARRGHRRQRRHRRHGRSPCAHGALVSARSLPSGRISTIRPSAFSRTRIMVVIGLCDSLRIGQGLAR